MTSSNDEDRPRRPLRRKYFVAFFFAVSLPLIADGAIQAVYVHNDQRRLLDARLAAETHSAALQIANFLEGVTEQLGWLTHVPVAASDPEEAKVTAYRVLRQVPAVFGIRLLDGVGIERLSVSRTARDEVGSGTDQSSTEPFRATRDRSVWYGPVSLRRETEPYMQIAVTGNRRSAGVVVADVNLSAVSDAVTPIRIGKTGVAFVADADGHLVAHPDIEQVLKGADPERAARLAGLREALLRDGQAQVVPGLEGNSALMRAELVRGPGWTVFTESPTAEAFAPVRRTVIRSLWLVVAGVVFAFLLAHLLAGRLSTPIRALERAASEIAAGNFLHRVHLRGGDELESLGTRFNAMAADLSDSRDRSERIGRLRRFLSPSVAEIVEHDRDDLLLAPRSAWIAVIFCDLRGFTAFCSTADAAGIMSLLDDYYGAVGQCVARHGATLTQLSGDGVMVILNAPMPCEGDVAEAALAFIRDLRNTMLQRSGQWRTDALDVGFGIGAACGEATVGRVGNTDRHEYTAIGQVVNLSSRLCAEANDGEALLEMASFRRSTDAAEEWRSTSRHLKGFPETVAAYSLV